MHTLLLCLAFLCAASILQLACAQTENLTPDSTNQQQNLEAFYQQVMLAPALLPADMRHHEIGLSSSTANNGQQYKSALESDYFKPDWEQRIAHNWHYFSAPSDLGRIVLIDFKSNQHQQLSYRYLANQGSQHQLYEPWSSSKIMAFSAAMAKVRQQHAIGAGAIAGDVSLADLITSIHSYAPFGAANGDSNAIATYFTNVSGRDRLTALFHDQWLMLSNPAIRFRGAYDNQQFEPANGLWHQQGTSVEVGYFKSNQDDPGYQHYRCEHCGLTGNKPMSTLAQAEWLKRLASHEREPLTRMPYLQNEDIDVLFFGSGHSDKQRAVGGMLQGISLMLTHALAKAISAELSDNPKGILDKASHGEWRIWQKIGWGPSETRGSGEVVVLAHVVLPYYQGGKEFTIAAQAAAKGQGEIYVKYAGQKMQSLLSQSLTELFLEPSLP